MAEYTYEEKENFEGKKVKVLGPTYEEGKPQDKEDWKEKLDSVENRLGYLRTALRYWYSKEWYGSGEEKTRSLKEEGCFHGFSDTENQLHGKDQRGHTRDRTKGGQGGRGELFTLLSFWGGDAQSPRIAFEVWDYEPRSGRNGLQSPLRMSLATPRHGPENASRSTALR